MATATLSEFRNESYTDFSQPANRQAMEEALKKVRSQLGREYQLRIGGEWISTGDTLVSVNPSRVSEVVGIHHKATPELAQRAVESASAYFTRWSRTPAQERVGMLLETARILRERKFEFNAWMVFEAGKTWIEAEAEIAEAIDFCEYYAREMNRLDGPQPVVQLPGEHDEMIYIPLGVGVVIPPWNFPLAILAGMTVASLVAGNTVIVKPSSGNSHHCREVRRGATGSRIPRGSLYLAHGQRRQRRGCAGAASQDPFRLVHGLARRRPAHQRAGCQAPGRTDLDQTRNRGNGR